MSSRQITFRKGDRVSLSGLRTLGMNGKRGTIVSLPDPSNEGRYGVRVDGSRKPIGIKPANILPATSNEAIHQDSACNDGSLLQKGDRVTLYRLKAPSYNGRRGIVVSLPDSSSNCKEGRYGIRIDGIRKPMGVKPENLRPLAKSTLEYQKELDELKNRDTPTDDECANADQLALMRMMMGTFLSKEQQIQLFGRTIEPVPDFRLEMIHQGGGFPKGVDPTWANNFLRRVYEEQSNLPHMFEVVFKEPNYKPSQKDLMKRLGFFDQNKVDWYLSGKPGDVFEKDIAPLHPECFRYSFSNQAYKKEVLSQGRTHVAVGFVDLGMLLAADMERGGDDAPLRFVGIDSSAYVVAKTLLVWELIQHAGRIVDTRERESYQRYIAQVWFSTTWSKNTERAVKKGLSSLLVSPGKEFETEVRLILEHWHRAASIPLKTARAKLQSLKAYRSASIGMLKKQRDRIAVAKYKLTGDFCVSNPTCGSLVLLDCPDGTPPCLGDETVFSALDFQEIMKIVTREKRTTMVDAAETHVLAGIAKLILWCASNRLSVELRCSMVQDSIDEIASMKPWTMSWSNVLDYIDHREFHRMARECSKHGDTIHFGYSMNWPSDVWGTSLIDYAGSHLTDVRQEILENSHKGIREAYSRFGWENHFRFPLAQNPINTVAKVLQSGFYQAWTDHFFRQARREGLFCKVGQVAHGVFSPLSSTGDNTVSFSWTYDPEISLSFLQL